MDDRKCLNNSDTQNVITTSLCLGFVLGIVVTIIPVLILLLMNN